MSSIIGFFNRIFDICSLRGGGKKLLFAIVSFLFMTSVSLNAWSALIGHWTLDEGSGLNAADISGNGRIGRLLAAPGGSIPLWINDGINGKALRFDGKGYVDLANTASLNFGTGGFTIAAWVRYGTVGYGEYMIVSKHSAGYPNGYFIENWNPTGDANVLAFFFNSDPRSSTTATYDDQQWHFIVGTNDGATGRLYVDGQLVTSSAGAPAANTVNLLIGGVFYNTGSFAAGFVGDIDDVRVYDNALTQAEVNQLYQEVKIPASQSNLIDATYGAGAGSFELGNFVNYACSFCFDFMPLGPGATTIKGWTVGGPGDGVDWLTTPTFRADNGVHSVDLQHFLNSSIATVIPTVTGAFYKLSFSAASVLSSGANTGVVSAGSLVNQPFTATLSSGGSTQTYTQFTFPFTATGPTTTIQFTATGRNISSSPTYGPIIDSVSVQVVDLCGEILKISCSYEFSLEQGTQKTESIQLINPGTVPRTATLEVLNPHPDLITVTLPQPNPTIAAGETLTLPITLGTSTTTPAGVYDDLLLKVTADDGSTLYASLKVYVTPAGAGQLPDLAITANDIRSTTNPDGTVTLTADIRNSGLALAENVQVQFYEFGNALEPPVTVAQIASNGIGTASITVSTLTAGDHLIRVAVDPTNAIIELDETNNEASRLITIGSSGPPTEGSILVTGSLPTKVYTDSLFTLNGRAVYDLYVNGTRITDYVVKGGSVQITVKAEGGTESWVYGDVYTDVDGNFSKVLQAPTTPGTYRIVMTVTDKTFVGTRELFFGVIDAPATPPAPPSPPPVPSGDTPAGTWVPGSSPDDPWNWIPQSGSGPAPASDLWVFSKNIYFSKNNPAADEEITVFAEIFYWAPSTALVARNVPINVYATYPGSAKVKIGQTLIPSLRVGSPDYGSRYVYATWKNQGDGIYLIEFEIDPSYAETNKLNNAATRAIIVGQVSGSAPGVISGQVTDSSGGVGNVMIQVLDASSGQIGNAITDATGFYLVGNLPLGALQVRIVAPSGYVPDAETKTATVTGQAVSTVDFRLTTQPEDTTPPDIQANIDGTLGQNGWYTSNATVSWTVIDPESTVNSKSGCEPSTVSADTSGVTFTCSATSTGGTAEKSVTVKRDATPPTIAGSATPAANASGWRNSPVTASFTCNDATSGIATCTSPQTLNEGANQTASGTATDKAGNTASAQVTGISVDLTPPTVSVTGVTDGASYPLGSVPTVGCATTDALSGVQTQAALSVTGGNPSGSGTFTASCAGAADKAGNAGATASATYQVYAVDTTPPAIAPIVNGTLGNNGWYTSNVAVGWAVTDGESAITAQNGCDTATVATDTAGVTFTCSATSGGGMASNAVTVKRDATPPTVSVTGVANGATYAFGSVPPAGCATADALSGVQAQAALSVTGGNPSGSGTFTASCAGALDNAGNAGATASATYTVTDTPPSTSAFSAFSINKLAIDKRLKTFVLLSNFTLGQGSNGIDPATEPVTFAIANFATTIPAGSFRKGHLGVYAFAGKINNVWIEALIAPLGGNRFGFQAAAYGASLSGAANPVTVGLTIGNDGGTITVNNAIIR